MPSALSRAETHFSHQQALGRLLERFETPTIDVRRHRTPEGLTEREPRSSSLIARATPTPRLAATLVLSEATMKTHVSNVLRKLGVRDRVQAVIAAYDAGLVEPRPD